MVCSSGTMIWRDSSTGHLSISSFSPIPPQEIKTSVCSLLSLIGRASRPCSGLPTGPTLIFFSIPGIGVLGSGQIEKSAH